MTDFKHIWSQPPIDFWEGATIANERETERVLAQMPEAPRYKTVYKMWLPHDVTTVPVFLCTADNNGTCYIFSDYDCLKWFAENTEIIR